MKAKLPNDRKIRSTPNRENLASVVLKTKITPTALAAPKSTEIPHTIARRIVIVINLSLLVGVRQDSNSVGKGRQESKNRYKTPGGQMNENCYE